MKWNITPEDVARGRLVEPGWHPAEITDYKEKLSKGKDSHNAIFTFKILGGDFEGTTIDSYFNEKAAGAMTGLLEALGFEKNDEGGFTVELSKDSMVSRQLKIHVTRGEYNGKPNNQINEFASME